MLALVGGDVRNSGEDITRVGSRALDAVSMVDATLAGLGVHIEPLKVVVEVDGAGAQVSPQKRGVGGEDGGHIDAALLAERQTNAGKPLVEMGDDGLFLLVANVLQGVRECQDVAAVRSDARTST